MTYYYLKLYMVTLGAFFAIDMLWLGVVARGFYRQHLGHLLAPSTNWIAAVLFYLLFVFGIIYFVVAPGLETGTLKGVLLRAALYGLITYATYDLTNLATVRDWPVLLTVVDIAWGVTLSLAVSTVSFVVGRWLT